MQDLTPEIRQAFRQYRKRQDTDNSNLTPPEMFGIENGSASPKEALKIIKKAWGFNSFEELEHAVKPLAINTGIPDLGDEQKVEQTNIDSNPKTQGKSVGNSHRIYRERPYAKPRKGDTDLDRLNWEEIAVLSDQKNNNSALQKSIGQIDGEELLRDFRLRPKSPQSIYRKEVVRDFRLRRKPLQSIDQIDGNELKGSFPDRRSRKHPKSIEEIDWTAVMNDRTDNDDPKKSR